MSEPRLRGPEERVIVAACRVSCPRDLAPIVDRGRVAERSAQCAQVLHAAGRGPPERVKVVARRVETFYTQALAALPQIEINYTSAVYAGDALLVQWTAFSTAGRITDGVDTFIFAGGAIRLQTSTFTIEPMASL